MVNLNQFGSKFFLQQKSHDNAQLIKDKTEEKKPETEKLYVSVTGYFLFFHFITNSDIFLYICKWS